MSEPVTGIAPAQRSPMRWIALSLVSLIVIAAIVLPLININRYHRTIVDSLSRSLGRPVHLGSVQLQLLPRPGLAITDFVVEEEPGFGAEPLLRAPSVTVYLRPSSLWRERLEVSRIDLDTASVNLVRDAHGQWNFSSLLVQAARTPNAPTAQRHATATLRFPYIDFHSARINFKTGAEKQPFSFFNADLSIWLAEPDQWQLRFEAQPARTDLDLDLADTGLIRIEGSLSRAAALDQIPVKLHVEWNKAPLGQVSRMLFGDDSGWRGLLRAEADFTGDISNLQTDARFRVDDAHRQEFTPLNPLAVDVRCRAAYHRTVASVDDLTCLWPAGDGHLLLTGSFKASAQPVANLTLEINRTPASFAVSALGLLRRGLTPSLNATGLINGHFTYASGQHSGHESPTLTGAATVDSLSMNFPGVDKPFTFPALHFATAAVTPRHNGRRVLQPTSRALGKYRPHTAILLDPAPLALGALNPLELSGQFTATGFALRLTGQADVARIATLSKSSGLFASSLAGLTTTNTESTATADLDLALNGPWITGPWMTPLSGATPTPPSVAATGSLRVEHAQAKFDWLPEPVEIVSATANFSPGKVTWSNVGITVNGITARGSYIYPLPCPTGENCEESPATFNLDIPNLDAEALQSALMGAGRHSELLSAILAQVERKTAPWPPLDGVVHIGTFSLADLTLHDARGAISIHDSRLKITSLDAATLGGSVSAAGTLEAGGRHPIYSLNLNWSGVSVPQVAALFHEKWGAGVANGSASLTLEGYSASDLIASAHGIFQWDWTRGSIGSGAPLTAEATSASLERASLNSMETAKFSPAHFVRWRAGGTIGDKALKLNPADITNPVTGAIGFDRSLDLSWPAADDATFHVGGTLGHPTLVPPRPVAGP